ncbi:MAG: phenylacetate-CoA oxygenase subunit PaaJ [Ignavibacteriae bacterium]|nr:phenylacetate-CoA oxygenase subunit PaaJ [Ignavibacteriota bacterium]
MDLIWKALGTITDPEIPVLSLVEMKIIRDVQVTRDAIRVVISPTFIGCPALEQMKSEIRARLAGIGFKQVEIETTFAPPWTTELLADDAKEKLRSFGIAPPPGGEGELIALLLLPVACPFCNSQQTRLDSEFGATLCKQIYFCDNCRQPFERFKPI